MTETKDVEIPIIYLTGFGPFGPYKENPSEAVVCQIVNSKLAEELGVKIIHEILDVDYNKTKEIVPQKHKTIKPKLIVHVGVSGIAKQLTLEEQSLNTGYCYKDRTDFCPSDHCCIQGGTDVLKTSLPLALVADGIDKLDHIKLKCVLSQDAGKFLCSYVYYLSLNHDSSRSVFVHVPPADVCPVEDTTASLIEVLRQLYKAVVGLSVTSKDPGDKTQCSVNGKCQNAEPNSDVKSCTGDFKNLNIDSQ